MADVVRNYKIRYSVQDTATPSITKLGTAVGGAETRVVSLTSRLKPLTEGLTWVHNAASNAADSIGDFNAAMSGMKDSAGRLVGIAQAFGRIDYNAGTAAASANQAAQALGSVAGKVPGINLVQAALQRAQRTTYGLKMNATEATTALGALAAQGPALKRLGTSITGLGASLKTTGGHTESLATSFLGISTTTVGFQAVKHVVDGVGDSIREARDATREWAGDALKLRDELRELANLKGKPGADDQVVRENLKLRMDTGMTQHEAKTFQEQFLGSLPLAKQAGGIDDATAGKLAGGVGRLATRTGLDGATAGDLAGVMGMFGKVPDATVGLGRAQQVVDLLNDGRGNLSPLTRALVKGAASTVGEGKAFGSLSERAAAISVASGIGDKNATDTTVGAAIRGLSPGGTVAHAATIERFGIGGNQSFMERIDRIAPLLKDAKARGQNPNDALIEAGFGNQVDRRAIIGFVENRETLRQRLASVKEDPNAPNARARAAGERSERLNAEFYAKDKAARNRVATARLDAAKLERGRPGEDLEIQRKDVEADMQLKGEIDTPFTNFRDKTLSLFGANPFASQADIRREFIDNEIKSRAGYNFKGLVSAETAARELSEKQAKQRAPAVGAPGPAPPPVVATPVEFPLPPELPPKPEKPEKPPKEARAPRAPREPRARVVHQPGIIRAPSVGSPATAIDAVSFRADQPLGLQDLVHREGQGDGPAVKDLLNRQAGDPSALFGFGKVNPGPIKIPGMGSGPGSPGGLESVLNSPNLTTLGRGPAFIPGAGVPGGNDGLSGAGIQELIKLTKETNSLLARDGNRPLPGPPSVYSLRQP